MSDAELVQQVLNGNEHAFRFLVATHQRLVLHIVGRIIKQQEDVEDVCQEVFMKVFRKIKNFRGDSKLSTWIATIAYNTGISYIRSKNRKNETEADDLTMFQSRSDNWQGQHAVEREEAKKILGEMIEELPVNYRTVLTLFHLEEFSYKEIEEITGMPEGTVKSYLSRARNLLKEKLEKIIASEKINIFLNYAEY
jgi:RNA polymerase sigma factor (sigma-70 family)